MPDLTPDPSLRRPPPEGARERVQRAGRRRRSRTFVATTLALVVLAAVPIAALTLGAKPRDTLLADDGGSVAPTAPGEPSAASRPAGSPPPAEPCPAVLDTSPGGPPAVPAPPPAGLSGALVPGEFPIAVAVCRYTDAGAFGPTGDGEPPEQVALDGERELTRGLEQLPYDLAVPAGTEVGGCRLVGGPLVPYLMRLTYPAGTVWVATRSDLNSCELVTNGAFTSAVYVGDQVAASFDAGAWVAEPSIDDGPGGACPFGPAGRAGQETELVPAGWTTLTVCVQDGTGPAPSRISDDRAEAVADLLNALPTEPGGGFGASCDQRLEVPGDDDRTRFLRWTYPNGRAVLVIPFIGCDAPLANGSLSADATAEQQAELLALLQGD